MKEIKMEITFQVPDDWRADDVWEEVDDLFANVIEDTPIDPVQARWDGRMGGQRWGREGIARLVEDEDYDWYDLGGDDYGMPPYDDTEDNLRGDR